nr:acetyl-CoA carboxylase subunit beta [Oenothera oakesiana]
MKPTKPEGPKKPNKSNEEAEELEGDNKEDLEGDKQKDKKDELFFVDYDDEEELEGDNKPQGDNKEDLEGDNKPQEDKQKELGLEPWPWYRPKHRDCPHRKHGDRKSVPAKERELVPDQSTKRDTDPDSEASLKSNYAHLWVHCKLCSGFNYKKILKSKNNVCEQCGSHLKMHSSDRIDLMLDPKTWAPMHEGLLSLDPIEFHSEKDPYKGRVASYKRKTGLSEAIQTGRGYLKGIPLGIGLMDFQFMGGSMGSVVGERITRLVEYATNRVLPLILVCASGGARMQEGSLSLMQMAKISSALSDYQFNRTVFYVALLTSPTTGGVTASFGMLGDIILAEPNAYIAFAGKRVIEQTLNIEVPEGSQTAEYLFDKGLFDQIVPRNPLKGSLSELFNFHGFVTLNSHLLL